jgi:putative hydroxymethylpyrimidine transport system substrate-binding protein
MKGLTMPLTRRQALAGLALGTTGIASAARAADKVTVLLDWFLNPDHAALVIAKTQGLFAKRNLEVELVVPADPSAPPKLVAAGKGDYAISYQPQLQLLVATERPSESLPLVRVGVLVAQPLNALVSLADGPVKSIADLKGRKVGFSVAGFEDAILAAMLETVDLRLKDVTLVNVNFNLTTALKSKQVDAVIGAFRNFELNDLEIENLKGTAFLVENHGVPVYDELVLVARRDGLDVGRTARLLDALREATDWLRQHPDVAWQAFAAYGGKEVANELNRRAWKDTLPLLASDPAALDRARYERFAAFLKARGLLKRDVPLDSYIREIR